LEKVEQLSLFPQDTLADLVVLPGSDKAKRTTAISGQNLSKYWKESGPVGSLVTMLLGTSLWGSAICLLTWRVSVTPGKQLLFRLWPLTPDTDEIEPSLWPTPRANDPEKRGNINGLDPRNGLPGAVKMHPKPGVQDFKNTIQSQIHRSAVPGEMWPTPTASQDWKPIRPLAPSEAAGSHGTMLVGAVGNSQPEYVGEQLNPNWVECLMGFPMGWTNIDVQE